MATIDGSIQLVKVVTDADLRQNGGSFVVAGRMAQPIQGFDTLTKRAGGGNAIPVYVVSDAQIADGAFRLKGGSALPMADIDVVAAGVKTIQGTAIPVYVVSGSGIGTNVPAAPTGLTATAVSASQIDLAWNASTGATGYEIERGVNGIDFVLIDTVGAVTSYEDTGLSGGTYYYRILATNAGGDSEYSNAASAITLATYTVTTVGAATHTINNFGVAAAQTVTIDWGDSTTNDYTGTAQRTHNYAGAGTYLVRIYTPQHVRTFDMRDNKAALHSANIAVMSGISTFVASTLTSGAFDFADIAGWNPEFFQINNAGAGLPITFDSADIAGWNPTTFYLYANTTISATLVPAEFAVFLACNNFRMYSNGFSQAQVNAILYGFYLASIAPRTATGGTINIAGTNAAPSGTYQAAAACPVTSSTPGKEVAYELINDTCDAFANHWATVTITA